VGPTQRATLWLRRKRFAHEAALRGERSPTSRSGSSGQAKSGGQSRRSPAAVGATGLLKVARSLHARDPWPHVSEASFLGHAIHGTLPRAERVTLVGLAVGSFLLALVAGLISPVTHPLVVGLVSCPLVVVAGVAWLRAWSRHASTICRLAQYPLVLIAGVTSVGQLLGVSLPLAVVMGLAFAYVAHHLSKSPLRFDEGRTALSARAPSASKRSRSSATLVVPCVHEGHGVWHALPAGRGPTAAALPDGVRFVVPILCAPDDEIGFARGEDLEESQRVGAPTCPDCLRLLAGLSPAPTTPTPSPGEALAAPETGATGDEAPARPQKVRPLDEILADIDSRIGLSQFKGRIHSEITYEQVEVRKKEVDPSYVSEVDLKRGSIYEGPPGTGKTMCAALHAEALAAIGISNGRFEATSASRLLTENIGGARERTKALVARNAGGAVFIDEFGAVLEAGHMNGNTGLEIVTVLLDAMENDPTCPVVIIADYEGRTDKALALNAGFASRFRTRFAFKSYTPDELLEIAELNIDKDSHELSLEPDARAVLKDALAYLYRTYSQDTRWSSGRVAVDLYREVKRALNLAYETRVALDPSASPFLIHPEDVRAGLRAYLSEGTFSSKATPTPSPGEALAALLSETP
jgi:hypothetical protein